ncbi:hypothetical protein PLICRDRAFT_532137, partial [Plicaturopsis crispa FD-325 SS-3]
MPWDDDDGQASEGSESDSSSSDDDEEEDAGWERPAPPHPASSSEDEDEDGGMSTDEDTDDRVRTEQRRATAEDKLRQEPIISHFPSPRAGEPLRRETSAYSQYREKVYEHNNVWAPFSSRLDWEFAQWAKTRGPGSTAVSELLGIKGIRKKLDLSYKNSRELNKIIDEQLPTRPRFERHEVVVDGEPFEMYCRDVIACVRDLYGDPEFAPYLVFVPERHYADKDKTIRMYHDMYTGKWWWSTQKKVESDKPGATIIPVIISSDKTQEIRRKPSRKAYILLAYLPTTRLEHMTNKSARRRALANLFHSCMDRALNPLADAGIDGLTMASGDGVVRRTHPIYATYVGDYPEQVLVTCIKTGECPTCEVPRNKLGDEDEYALRNLSNILDALDSFDLDDLSKFAKACTAAGIKPIHHPFWQNLPYAHPFRSITPDILHQLYQGIVKHLILWIRRTVGDAEIDARCRRLPPNHNIRLFMKGLSNLSRVSGTEHSQMCAFLLALIVDIRLPNGISSVPLVKAVRALLDFV